jgi:hypothetical protein
MSAMIDDRTPIEKVADLAVVVAKGVSQQTEHIMHILKTMGDLADVLTAMEASNALLEARVQFLEADNGDPLDCHSGECDRDHGNG